MKTFTKVSHCLLLALAGGTFGTVHAADKDDEVRRNYWAVQGGPNQLRAWPGTINFGGPSADASLTLKSGATVGAVLGRQIGKARYDIEYQHGRLDISAVRIAALSEQVDATLKYDTLTVNAWRQLRVGERWLAYAGVGAGYGRVNLPAITLTSSSCKCFTKIDKGGAVVQLRLGTEYELSEDGLAYLQIGLARLPGAVAKSVPSISYPHRQVATLALGYRGFFQ